MTNLDTTKASDHRETPSGRRADGTEDNKNRLGTYLALGLVVVAIGVAALAGASQLGSVDTDQLTPARIAEIRAAQFAEQAESVYRAQLAEIYDQRAQDMVDFYSRQHQARNAASSGGSTPGDIGLGGPTRSAD